MAKNTWVLRKRNSQNKSFIEKKNKTKEKEPIRTTRKKSNDTCCAGGEGGPEAFKLF